MSIAAISSRPAAATAQPRIAKGLRGLPLELIQPYLSVVDKDALAAAGKKRVDIKVAVSTTAHKETIAFFKLLPFLIRQLDEMRYYEQSAILESLESKGSFPLNSKILTILADTLESVNLSVLQKLSLENLKKLQKVYYTSESRSTLFDELIEDALFAVGLKKWVEEGRSSKKLREDAAFRIYASYRLGKESTDDKVLKSKDGRSVLASKTKLSLVYYSLELTSLPPEISQLTKLKELHLSCNKLTDLSFDIGCLADLEVLHLDYNSLSSIPSQIALLTKLRSLRISNNGLSSLPHEICLLNNLLELIADSNNLSDLPFALRYLTKLKVLHLHRNKLTDFHPGILRNLIHLRELVLDHNPIPDEEQLRIKQVLSEVITHPIEISFRS